MSAPGAETAAGGPHDPPKVSDLSSMPNIQSMDWLLKKEGFFLLAQFWQQRATLAETELSSLKEQLENCKVQKTKENNNNNNINNNNHNNNHTNVSAPNSPSSTSPNSLPKELGTNKSEAQSNSADETVESANNERLISSPSPQLSISEQERIIKEKEARLTSLMGNPAEGTNVLKLVEDVKRLREALSGVQETSVVQMQALEEQLAKKNILIKQLELRLEGNKDLMDVERKLGNGRGLGDGLSLPPRSLEGFFNKDHEVKLPPSDFGLSHMSHLHLPNHLRPPLQHQLAPPPLISPLQPLAPHPPPGTPLHHLLGEDWRRSFERERHNLTSGQMSPDSGGGLGSGNLGGHQDRDSRDSPIGDMKSPSSLVNGFQSESKSPFAGVRDDKSPFKDELHLGYRFEDRISGESLIPKGDPMEARLQEILRFNMDKYCHQNLDTLSISRRIRELLSIHNIGQRLFAKYVLGLSQGTVSELLSKPKPWDKLTEKGRDSYRKMHAWGTDDNAVYLLKSLIPKKGKLSENNFCEFGTKEVPGCRNVEETVTEERIQHILTEASRAMTSVPGPMPLMPLGTPQGQPIPPVPCSTASQDQDARSTDSKSPASSTHSPSPLSREGRQRSRKHEEDISQDKVARIYQEELLKLMSRQSQEQALGPRDPSQYPGLLFPFLGQSLLMNRGHDEMKMAFDAYHQELSKLQSGATPMGLGAAGLGMGVGGVGIGGGPPMGLGLGAGGMHNGVQDLSLPKREHRSGDEDEDSHRMPNVSSPSPFGMTRVKSEAGLSSSSPINNLVTPITSIANSNSNNNNSNGNIEDPISTSASPLQRMASITNSLMTSPPLSGANAMPQKPMKAVLPPITQQQFDQYSNMNTEDIVKKVKEQLSQYSISQRLFGESVLGLSQGSVSDLLARPKPWHMLTQKGREPFIRMKMFLEDDNAVHKLVASQYKIAPEKLMRTGGYAAPPLWLVEDGCLGERRNPLYPPFDPRIADNRPGMWQKHASTSKPHHIKLPADLPKTSIHDTPLPPVGIPASLGGLPMPGHHHHHHQFDTRMPILDPLRKVNMPGIRVPGPVAPSVYEMAALTQDLDTQVITTKIKEALLANNIGQKLFGEAVLGLSQGSVSELLSKPKPWHMLSIKGREPFIRMQLWLNDPHNLEKLQVLKNERREQNKRRRALDPSVEISQEPQDLFQVPSPGGSSKKARVLFSEEQKEALKIAFALDPYPSPAAIEFLAQELQLSTRTITNWFHNHRMRLKQNSSGSGSPVEGNISPGRDIPSSQTPFDPINFRILLSQRLMELRKEKGLPPSLPGFPGGLPPCLPTSFFPHFPHFGMGMPFGDRDHQAGLDLSMKTEQECEDSYIDEDSVMSGATSPTGNRSEGEEMDRDGNRSSSPVSRSSSRRKPSAPQWVNPSWATGPDAAKEREVIINGVCVMQTHDFRQREEETVLIEPTAVEESRRSSEYPSDCPSDSQATEENGPHSPAPSNSPRRVLINHEENNIDTNHVSEQECDEDNMSVKEESCEESEMSVTCQESEPVNKIQDNMA